MKKNIILLVLIFVVTWEVYEIESVTDKYGRKSEINKVVTNKKSIKFKRQIDVDRYIGKKYPCIQQHPQTLCIDWEEEGIIPRGAFNINVEKIKGEKGE